MLASGALGFPPGGSDPGAWTWVDPAGIVAYSPVELARGRVVPSQVCTGASLQCSFGTTPSTFAATGVEVSATAVAGVVSDVAPSNVPPFGMCTSLANPQVAAATSAAMGALTPQPCMPVLSPWTPGSAEVTIGGVAALDDSSQCSCSWAGVVTVASAGQTSVTLG
jgi:hypothetical protein